MRIGSERQPGSGSASSASLIALTAFDLGVLHKEDKEMGIAESLKLSAFYISIAMAFGVWVWMTKGADLGMKYYTGFFIEKALSIDNVFVISLIFTFFAIPRKYQYRALLVGHHRGNRAARADDRGGCGHRAGILLGALYLRRVPDRDGHQACCVRPITSQDMDSPRTRWSNIFRPICA